jgi:hypothetical protein
MVIGYWLLVIEAGSSFPDLRGALAARFLVFVLEE